MQSAVERWHALLQTRAQQMDTAYARLGRSSADFWDRRARGFHRATKDTIALDPFFSRLQREVTAQATVLDIGAGTGRFTLALAPLVQHITAVEPSPAMLKYLHNDVSDQGLTNITILQTTWQEAPADLAADIVICCHVLYPIQDIVPFLTKLQAAARQTCYLYLRATHVDAITAHLWQHFHSGERCLPPGYIHALDVLFEMDIYADVEIVKLPISIRYPSLDVAVEELLEQLILPDEETKRSELRGLLEDWLIVRDGMLVPPVKEMVCAIIKMPT